MSKIKKGKRPAQPKPVAPVPAPSAEPAHQSDFSKVVQESREAIQSTHLPPPKHSRGGARPGAGRKPLQASGAPPSNPSNGNAPSLETAAGPDISQDLKLPIQMLSKIPASMVGVEKVALDSDEALALAQALNRILNVYSTGPISPKAAAWLGFGAVGVSITLSKYQIYLEAKKLPNPIEAPVTKEGESPSAIPITRVDSPPPTEKVIPHDVPSGVDYSSKMLL